MKSTPPLLLAALVLSLLACTFADEPVPDGPTYASRKAERVVEQMVAAHGGLEAWRNAPSIRYDNVFFNPFAEDDLGRWWVSHEVIDQDTRRIYQEWPLDDAFLAYDGNETWTVGWKRGNPPKFQATMFYYFLNLPWLTQDATVRLGEPGTGTLPGNDKTYTTVMMTFAEKPAVGKTTDDSFKLYIDPDTHLLAGYEYTIGYGAMLDLFGLPPGQLFGPVLRVHDDFATVDGLTVPTRFHTMDLEGKTTYGYHVVLNYSFSAPFDEARLKRPSDAVTDTSSDKRKAP